MYVTPEIVIGFHGCDQSVFDDVILKGNSLRKVRIHMTGLAMVYIFGKEAMKEL